MKIAKTFLPKVLMLSCIALAFVAATPNCYADVPANQIASDLQLFENKEKGYRLHLPKGWKTKTDLIVDVIAAPEETFKQPNPIPKIKVVVKQMPSGHTLDTITDTAVRQWSTIWKVESDKKLELGSIPMRKLVLLQTLKLPTDTEQPVRQQTKILKAFATSGDQYFIISCSNYEANFEKTHELFNRVVESLLMLKK